MKRKLVCIVCGCLLITQQVFSQSTTATNTYVAGRYLGWDAFNGANPLFFKTNNINRLKLNGNLSYTIDGYNDTRNGYLLLSPTNQSLHNTNGAFSMLHLNGVINPNGGGHRPWMKTGATFTDNGDMGYVGMRQVGTDADVSEMVISWSNDGGGPLYGPDDMAFRFTSNGDGNTSISSNLQTNNDLDGLHVARFTPTGEFGLGNTFGVNPVGTPANLYVRPASLGHYSLSNLRSVWQQFTNRDGTTGTGTGENETDGVRFGIIGNSNTNINGTGALYNQENRALLFSTNATTNAINMASGVTNERLRLMSVGTPTYLSGGSFGTFNPAGLNANFTRMAVSHNPASPITRPLSLLHLGYNSAAATPATDGWRTWMDLGMFTSNGTDNVYLGLKDEGGGVLSDRQDAVLNWGDNQTGNGPDNFRMIFTSATGGTAPATGANGLEGMRMTPTTSNGIFTGIGGDPTANLYGPAGSSINPTATLEVNSWGATNVSGGSSGLRFTNLNTTSPTITNPGTGVLGVNSNGDVVYVQSSGSGLGNTCGGTQNALTSNWEIPLGGHTLNITENANTASSLLIGLPTCTTIPARLGVQNDVHDVAGAFLTTVTNIPIAVGVYASTVNSGTNVLTIGLRAEAEASNGADHVMGVSVATISGTNRGQKHTGVDVNSANGIWQTFAVNGDIMNSSSPFNYGHQTEIYNSTPTSQNHGYHGTVSTQGSVNYGVIIGTFGATTNYGVFSTVSGSQPNNYAEYFNGDLYVSGAYLPSDLTLKKDVTKLENARNLIEKLNPVSYEYEDFEESNGLNLPKGIHNGFIAQEVEALIPNAVKVIVHPDELDSSSNLVKKGMTFKAVNYTELIPVAIMGIKEQNVVIDSLKATNEILQASNDSLKAQVNNLNDRLSRLENCLSGILPALCQMSHNAIQQNSSQAQELIRAQLSVYLSNKEAIILDQNVPNPFAEQTTINFSIPETVQKAQIQFFDGMGKLLKVVDIRERGLGSITVFGSDLSSGTYMYTLVADGVNVATKKMVKE